MGELEIGEDVQANPAGERHEHVGVSLYRGVFGPTGTKPRRGGNGPDKKQNGGKKRCHAEKTTAGGVTLKAPIAYERADRLRGFGSATSVSVAADRPSRWAHFAFPRGCRADLTVALTDMGPSTWPPNVYPTGQSVLWPI